MSLAHPDAMPVSQSNRLTGLRRPWTLSLDLAAVFLERHVLHVYDQGYNWVCHWGYNWGYNYLRYIYLQLHEWARQGGQLAVLARLSEEKEETVSRFASHPLAMSLCLV